MSNLLQLSKHFLKANLSMCLKTSGQTVSSRTIPILSTTPLRASGVTNVQGKGHSILSSIFIRTIHTSGPKYVDSNTIIATLTGSRLREWFKKQSKDVKRNCLMIAAVAAGIAFVIFGLVVYYYKHKLEAPITDRKRFISLSREKYAEAANQQSTYWEEQFKEDLVTNTTEKKRDNDIVFTFYSIIKANKDVTEMMDIPWKISVVESKETNVFVLQNGHLFLHTGIMEEIKNNTDRLAFVLGHEMSHALLLHDAEQLSRGQFWKFLLLGAMAAINYWVPSGLISMNKTVTEEFSKLNHVSFGWITEGFSTFSKTQAGQKKILIIRIIAAACIFILAIDWNNWLSNLVKTELSIPKNYSIAIKKEADEVGLYLAAKAGYNMSGMVKVIYDRMPISGDKVLQVGDSGGRSSLSNKDRIMDEFKKAEAAQKQLETSKLGDKEDNKTASKSGDKQENQIASKTGDQS